MPRLLYREDLRTIFLIAFYFTLVAAGYLLHDAMTWPMRIGWVVVCSFFAFINAALTHNIIHTPIFVDKRHNRLWQFVMTVAYGHPVSAYVRGHNLSHHHYTQTQRDVMRTTKARFRWNLLNQALFFFVVARDINRANVEYCRRQKTERPYWYRQFRNEWRVMYVAMAVLLLLDWQSFLLYFVVPHIYGTWGIVGMNFMQHDGCDETTEYNHSRNFVGPFVNWLTCNNGYHTAHHADPNMHWSLLPKVHAEQFAPHVHPNLDQRNVLVYLWTAYFWPGQRVTYDGRPYDPPPAGDDIDWIPSVAETPQGASLGAET